jgi:hypothetical protein
MKKIIIEKRWEGLHDQVYEDASGVRWTASELVDRAKDLPVLKIPLEHMYIDYKFEEMSLRALVSHMMTVLDCDLRYPIILDKDGVIMDGRHRLMKALLEGKKYILAKRFEK